MQLSDVEWKVINEVRKFSDDYRRRENNRCDNAGNEQDDDGKR